MVLEVFKSAVRITGGRMAIVLGTAVAITAFSACIAPLLHCQDDDEDNNNDKDLRNPPKQMDGIIQKPHSLYTIFMNGLRKIGVFPPPEAEKHQNTSKNVRIPRLPTSDASTSPLPQAKSPENHQKSIQCDLPEKPGEINKIKQLVKIQVVMSQSSQSTQTEEDYFSAAETTGSTVNSSTEPSNLENPETVISFNSHNSSADQQTEQKTDQKTDDDSQNSETVISTMNAHHSSTGQENQHKTDGSQENLEAILSYHSPVKKQVSVQKETKSPPIPKPRRAHPPKTFPVVVDVHQDASLRNLDENHNVVVNQTSFATRADDFEIGPTPTGRFQLEPPYSTQLDHTSSLKESQGSFLSSSGLKPVWASTYPVPLRSKFGFSPSRHKKTDNNLASSNSSFLEWLRRFYSRYLSPGKKKSSDLSDTLPSLPTVVRNRPAGVIRDLEVERERMMNDKSTTDYTASEVLSSTKMRNSSSSMRAQEVQPLNVTTSKGTSRETEDELSRCTRDLKENTNQLIKDTGEYLEVVRSNRKNQPQLENNVPARKASSLPAKDNHFNSGTTISESGTDYPLLPGEKKGISSRLRNLLHRRGRRRKGTSRIDCDSSFERISHFNPSQQLKCTEL